MKLIQLTTLGLRGVPDGSYSFTDPESGAPLDTVLITGGPATGKTSLLEAVVLAKEDVGAYGHRGPGERYVAVGRRTAEIEATWWLSPAERARAKVAEEHVITRSVFGASPPMVRSHLEGLSQLFRDTSGDARLGKFLYFHDARHLPSGRGNPHRPGGDTTTEARSRLTRRADKHAGLRDYLIDECLNDALELGGVARQTGVAIASADARGLHALRETFRPFLHGKVFDGIDVEGPGIYRVRFRTTTGAVLDLDDLSASERHGILIAATFHRLHVHSSIVLIDTPELAQSPERQEAFLLAVTRCGGTKTNQIIAATSSRALTGAPQWRSIRLG